jgi:hypothetical protein
MKEGMKKEVVNNKRNEVRKEMEEETPASFQKVSVFGEV